MSASERAVIYVESGADLSSLAVATSTSATAKTPSGRHGSGSSMMRTEKTSTSTTTAVVTTGGAARGGSNYVIKIQIGEENMFSPVRIDVSTGSAGPRTLRQNKPPSSTSSHEDDSTLNSSGQSSPRSDMTPPPRINSGAIRFGSETSESDTESDVSSEFRPAPCQAAQFALREICEAAGTPSPPPLPRSIMKSPNKSANNANMIEYKSTPPPPTVSNTHPGKNRENGAMGNSEYRPITNGNNVIPDFRRLKTTPSGRNVILSPDAIKTKEKLDAEIQKHGKLITVAPVANRKSTLGRSKVLMSIGENIAHNHISNNISAKSSDKRSYKKETDAAVILTEPNGFHLNEINECNIKESVVNEGSTESLNNFAGYRDIFSRNTGANPIMSEKGTIRGVKNRVRDGIATFLQSTDSKTYFEREQGRVVVYVTSMGVVRNTFQRCQKVKQILRNLLVKFDERDCYMNRAIQNEIRHRLPNFDQLALPQVFLEGQHLGDAELIEKLNESGELRDLLRPYKSLSVLTTCDRCGGFRMLPCPVCNGSKKSVHRNHFTTEFVALKCMHCDLSGLVRCDLCNASEA